MGSSPTSGNMINCDEIRKMYNRFFENKLSPIEKRKFYFHMKNCEACREDIKDEYNFYAAFNDKDKNYDFNINDDLKKKFMVLEDDVVIGDNRLYLRYTAISIIITMLLFLTLVLAIRFVFK